MGGRRDTTLKLLLRTVLLLIGTLSDITSLSTDCEFNVHENILDCSNMTNFPIGSYQEVETINFSRNNFTALHPFIFFNHKFNSLETVLLRHSNIQYIHPDTFGMMDRITQLDLNGNRLVKLHKNSFSGLVSLKYLDLGHNQIISIEKVVLDPLLSLESLDLSNNYIQNLETGFVLKSVRKLELSHNPLQFSQEGAILESFSLTELSLQSCNLTKIPKHAFGMLPLLEYLDLSRNKLVSISDVMLKDLKQLNQLDISYNNLVYLNIDVSELPMNLNVVFCNDNPPEPLEGLNCPQLVESLQSRKCVNKTGLKLKRDLELGGELYATTQINSISNVIKNNGDTIEAVLKMSICGVAGACVVLLIIFLGLIYYLPRPKCRKQSSKSVCFNF